MKPNRHNSAPAGPVDSNPVARRAAVRRSAVPSTLRVLWPLSVAVPVSVVLVLAGAGADWIGAVWLAAVLWAIGATVVQTLWRGLRDGDRSAFASCDLPRNDDDFDYTTRSGEFMFMRIQTDHEALMRDGDRHLTDHDHGDSLTL